MQRLCSIHLADSLRVGAANPMGWVPAFLGRWARVAEDYLDHLRGRCDGVLLDRADGSCRTRTVGVRSDGKIVTTEVASADMLDRETHRARVYIFAAIAAETRLVVHTGIPETKAGVALALERLEETRVPEVSVDVSGQNVGEVCGLFMEGLLALPTVQTVYHEPSCLPGLTAPAFNDRTRTASMPERLRLLHSQGVPIPAGSIARHNANNPLTDDDAALWAAMGVDAAVARGKFFGDDAARGI